MNTPQIKAFSSKKKERPPLRIVGHYMYDPTATDQRVPCNPMEHPHLVKKAAELMAFIQTGQDYRVVED